MKNTQLNNTNFNEASLRESAQADGIIYYAANAMVRFGDKFLLVRRHPKDSQGGLYEFPGGKVENHESLIEGLVREVFEETGLIIGKIHDFIGHYDFDDKGVRQFNFMVEATGEVQLSSEHDDFRWVEYTEVETLEVTDGTKTMLQVALALDKQLI